jgi:hypothetical protein
MIQSQEQLFESHYLNELKQKQKRVPDSLKMARKRFMTQP